MRGVESQRDKHGPRYSVRDACNMEKWNGRHCILSHKDFSRSTMNKFYIVYTVKIHYANLLFILSLYLSIVAHVVLLKELY